MPTFGSLFAGIGGIDLGLERAGWECRFQVEWDPFCQRVLAKHWPDVPRYGDITTVDWGELGSVDLLAGGFPCQPVSVAGKRRARDDERWLWPEFVRAIRVLRPRYVLVENVRNLLAIDDGGPYGEVVGDLAALGYDKGWDCIPASALGAPHERDRLWIVAYPDPSAVRIEPVGFGGSDGASVAGGSGSIVAHADSMGPTGVSFATRGYVIDWDDTRREEETGRSGERSRHVADADRERGKRRRAGPSQAEGGGSHRPAAGPSDSLADDDRFGLEGIGRGGLPDDRDASLGHDPDGRREALADADDGDAQGQLGGGDDAYLRQVAGERPFGLRDRGGREEWPPESRVVRAPHGVPAWMDGHRWPAPPGPQYEWEPPRTVKGRVPNRTARIKSLGNAVVPQVVEHIGRRLMTVHKTREAA